MGGAAEGIDLSEKFCIFRYFIFSETSNSQRIRLLEPI